MLATLFAVMPCTPEPSDSEVVITVTPVAKFDHAERKSSDVTSVLGMANSSLTSHYSDITLQQVNSNSPTMVLHYARSTVPARRNQTTPQMPVRAIRLLRYR